MKIFRLAAPLISYFFVLAVALPFLGKPSKAMVRVDASRGPASCLDAAPVDLSGLSFFQTIRDWPSISQNQWNYYFFLTALQRQSPFSTELSFGYLNSNPWTSAEFWPRSLPSGPSPSPATLPAMDGNPWGNLSLPIGSGADGFSKKVAPLKISSIDQRAQPFSVGSPRGAPLLAPGPIRSEVVRQSVSSSHLDPIHPEWATP